MQNEKNPILAAVLSLVITGLGQLYNGDVAKGIILFIAQIVVAVVLWGLLGRLGSLVSIVIWAYGIYDAYTKAKEINAGTYQPPPKTSW
jgi:TM2 domain-containing membrane protein YozV